MSQEGRESPRITGVLLGKVSDNQDPEGLGRVRVTLLSEDAPVVTPWARVASPMAGPGWGQFFLPEVGSRVLVAFESGDPASPYVIGSLWSKAGPPPAVPETAAKANAHRLIQTRSGHRLVFDDTEGAEKIELIDSTSKNLLRIDSTTGEITLQCQGALNITAAGAITVTADGTDMTLKCNNLTLEAAGKLSLSAVQGIALSSDQEVAIAAGLATSLKASTQQLALNGVKVVVNDGALEVT